MSENLYSRSSYIDAASSFLTVSGRAVTLNLTSPLPKRIETSSPTLSLTEGLAGLPLTVTLPAWQTSFATVLLFITLDNLRNLSSLIFFPREHNSSLKCREES